MLQQRQGISTGLASSVSIVVCVTTKTVVVCVTSETQHLDRRGQLGEFEQDSKTDSHSARSVARCDTSAMLEPWACQGEAVQQVFKATC